MQVVSIVAVAACGDGIGMREDGGFVLGRNSSSGVLAQKVENTVLGSVRITCIVDQVLENSS